MSTDTVVLLYFQVRMVVRVSATLTLLQFMSFLPMCIEPTYPASLLGTHPFRDTDVARLVYCTSWLPQH